MYIRIWHSFRRKERKEKKAIEEKNLRKRSSVCGEAKSRERSHLENPNPSEREKRKEIAS